MLCLFVHIFCVQRLLNERINRLYEAIKALQQCNPPSKVQESYQQALDIINEDVHWLLLLAGLVCFHLNPHNIQSETTLLIQLNKFRVFSTTLPGCFNKCLMYKR